MSEALEKWNADIFRNTLPRIWQIVCEMDRRCRADLAKAFPGDQGKIDYMAIIGDNQVRTANICAYTCHAINGVSSCTVRSSRTAFSMITSCTSRRHSRTSRTASPTAAGCSAPTRA